MLLLITNTKVNTFSTWYPPSLTRACWRWQPQFAWATPFSHIDRQFFSISPQLCSNFIVVAHTVCISLLYIVYTFYSISIWTVNNAAGWAKWRRRCLPSSPASALNSLTISTIKMCQKIFQFPYTQEGKYGRRGEGEWEGLAGGCCSKLTLFNFHKILWQRARATDLRQQRRFGGVSLSLSLSLLFCLSLPLWLNGDALLMLCSIDGSLWRCVASCRVTEAEVPVSIIYLVVYSNNNNKNGIQKISCLLLCNSNICTVSWRVPTVPPSPLHFSLQLFEQLL